jgi:hypothetical protein
MEYEDWIIFDGCASDTKRNEPVSIEDDKTGTAIAAAKEHVRKETK